MFGAGVTVVQELRDTAGEPGEQAASVKIASEAATTAQARRASLLEVAVGIPVG